MPIFSFIGHTPTELFVKTDNWRQIYKHNTLNNVSNTSNNVSLKRVEKKKLLGRISKDISLKICRGSHLCEMAV